MADIAPSDDKGSPSEKPSSNGETPSKSADQDARRATFDSTKQHVARRQGDGGTIERFTNTKLNIALINDPKNGPRFTLTKRESGLETTKDAPADPPEAASNAPKSEDRQPPAESGRPESASAASRLATPKTAAGEDRAAEARVPIPDAVATDRQQAAAARVVQARAAPSGMPPAAEPPSKVPVDSSKTFVGPNGTYYDESWRWMDWRGTRRSWNWPAALTFGHWFAYRRLHVVAGLYLLWLGGLAAATVNDVPILALVLVALLVVGLAGVYANTLYFFAFRRAVEQVTEKGEGSYQELKSQLAEAGGTSATSASVMAGLTAASITAALGATFYLRGGFLFNFWPFF